MRKVTARFTLKAKHCDKTFAEDLEPGVLVVQELVYTLPDSVSPDNPRFRMQMLKDADAFMHANIEVETATWVDETPD